VPSFDVDQLFQEKSVSQSLLKIERPEALQLSPSQLYEKIRYVAKKRYSFELPEKQTDLKCLQNANHKISLLRDICIKIGVKILSHTDRDYILDNDANVLLNKLTQQLHQEINSQQQKA